jgi:hypothetical protein
MSEPIDPSMGHHVYFAVEHGSDALVPHADPGT